MSPFDILKLNKGLIDTNTPIQCIQCRHTQNKVHTIIIMHTTNFKYIAHELVVCKNFQGSSYNV
jgi:hypothetical protein